MKLRAIALLCVAALSLSLCACAAPTGETVSSTQPVSSAETLNLIDVVEYASRGEIYGCEFALGTSLDAIKAAYHYGENNEESIEETESVESAEESTESEEQIVMMEDLTVTEGMNIQDAETIRLATGSAKFYSRFATADQGISFIALFDDPFSYYVGLTTPDEILRTVKAEPRYQGEANEMELFFYFGVPENVTEIKYTFGEYDLVFYFENDRLSATSICAWNNWQIYGENREG